jgi:hypothetical protein
MENVPAHLGQFSSKFCRTAKLLEKPDEEGIDFENEQGDTGFRKCGKVDK